MLKIRAWQDQTLDPDGWCRLEITGADLSADVPVEICFRRGGENRPFLGERDWQEDEAWLSLEIANRQDGVLTGMAGPEMTVPLSAVTTVEVRLRDAGGDLKPANRTRIAWPKIILPGANTAGAVRDTPPPPPPAPPPPPPPPPPGPGPIIDPEEETPPPGGKSKWIILAVILLMLAGGGYAWFAGLIPFGDDIIADSGPSYTQDSMQAFIATNPDGSAATAKAAEFLKAGKPDLALLIYRYADRRNDPEAATAIGRMYDPATHKPETSPFPSPSADQAVTYYLKAAEAGDPAGQYALGQLMMSGATSGPNDAEQGVVWLQRAAKQGNADAINALQKLGVSN
ncbi:MAG: hypothetical protein RIC36_14175 [Rhodospirillales bacterium]